MFYFEELTNTRLKRPSSMVAGISSKILQIRKESIKQSLSDLNTIGHRQEYVATVEGVMYYDDSRAENVNATWFTFQNIVKPVIWIAGGNDRNSDFKDLKSIAAGQGVWLSSKAWVWAITAFEVLLLLGGVVVYFCTKAKYT